MASTEHQRLGMQLTAMAVGGKVGAAISSLPRTFANATGPSYAVIAWLIAGTSLCMPAQVFQAFVWRKPALDAEVFAYAETGFAGFPGFLSAFGHWMGSCIGNVACWVPIKPTLPDTFFPVYGEVNSKANTLVAIVVASIVICPLHLMIQKPVQQAVFIDSVAKVARSILTWSRRRCRSLYPNRLLRRVGPGVASSDVRRPRHTHTPTRSRISQNERPE